MTLRECLRTEVNMKISSFKSREKSKERGWAKLAKGASSVVLVIHYSFSMNCNCFAENMCCEYLCLINWLQRDIVCQIFKTIQILSLSIMTIPDFPGLPYDYVPLFYYMKFASVRRCFRDFRE